MGKVRSELSSAVRELIVESYRNNKNKSELSKVLGIPRTTISSVITRNWLQARLSVYPPQNNLKLANNFRSQTFRKFVKDIFSAL